MGKIANVSTFCEKKVDNKENYMRGFLDKSKKDLVCETGQKVILAYSCKDRQSLLCSNSKVGCEDLQKILAKNLKLYQHSLRSDSDSKKSQEAILHCIFLSQDQLNVDKVDL